MSFLRVYGENSGLGIIQALWFYKSERVRIYCGYSTQRTKKYVQWLGDDLHQGLLSRDY